MIRSFAILWVLGVLIYFLFNPGCVRRKIEEREPALAAMTSSTRFSIQPFPFGAGWSLPGYGRIEAESNGEYIVNGSLPATIRRTRSGATNAREYNVYINNRLSFVISVNRVGLVFRESNFTIYNAQHEILAQSSTQRADRAISITESNSAITTLTPSDNIWIVEQPSNSVLDVRAILPIVMACTTPKGRTSAD